MPSKQYTFHRVLAVAPVSRGFGFVVLEGMDKFVDRGVKSAKADKNANCLVKVEKLMTQYMPGIMVLQDTERKDSRRAPRIQALTTQLITLGKSRKVRVVLFSRDKVKRAFFADGQGTKHDIAEILARRFPDQLALELPPERKDWDSEDPRMAMFDAVALALTFWLPKKRGSPGDGIPLG